MANPFLVKIWSGGWCCLLLVLSKSQILQILSKYFVQRRLEIIGNTELLFELRIRDISAPPVHS